MEDPNEINFDNLCLQGGGIKGCAFLGMARALTELNKLSSIKRFIGSSAGAIFATGMACCIPVQEMEAIIYSTDFTQFMDGNYGQVGQAGRLLYWWGLYNGDYFYNWFGDILEKWTGNRDITFEQIYEKFGKELVITGSNVSTKTVHYFTKDNEPEMSVRLATRISMSIPIFYVPVYHNDCYWVDGGYLDNYPLAYFDPVPFFGETIGFKLHTDVSLPSPINGIADYITNLLETAVEQIENLRLKPGDELRTVLIHTFNIKGTDFDISRKDIGRLILSGYKATMAYFNKWEGIEKNFSELQQDFIIL